MVSRVDISPACEFEISWEDEEYIYVLSGEARAAVYGQSEYEPPRITMQLVDEHTVTRFKKKD